MTMCMYKLSFSLIVHILEWSIPVVEVKNTIK